ncbi:MAG TPA: hypothetical protein VIU61_13695 [Kofleriaceae bacterium]
MREPPIPAATIRGSLPAPPPESDAPLPEGVVVVPTYPMYSAGQMALATFLGTPFAGCLLLGKNYSRLRKPGAAWLAYGIGALVTGLLLFAAIAVEGYPRIFSVAGVIVIGVLGRALQGDAYDHHERSGGRRASWWVTVGLSLLTTLCWVVLVVAAVVAYEYTQLEPSVERNGGEVFHPGATAAEATAVADFLAERGYFDGDAASVRLEREGDRMVALFVVKDTAIRDDKVKTYFEGFASELSERGLGGKPVDIYLTDDQWERRTSILWESRAQVIAVGKDKITIRRGTDEAQARRFAALLQSLGEFDGTGHNAMLDRHGRFRATFAVGADITKDGIEHIHRIAWRIATHVFEGSPVDIVLIDDNQVPVHRLSWDKRPPDPFVTAAGNEIHRLGTCTEDEARGTAEVLAAVLAARVEVQIACNEEVAELMIYGEKRLTTGDIAVEKLSQGVFGDRPVDLWLHGLDRGEAYAWQKWADRPRKTTRKR